MVINARRMQRVNTSCEIWPNVSPMLTIMRENSDVWAKETPVKNEGRFLYTKNPQIDIVISGFTKMMNSVKMINGLIILPREPNMSCIPNETKNIVAKKSFNCLIRPSISIL